MMCKQNIQLLIIGLFCRLLCQHLAPKDFVSSIANAANDDWERVQEEISLFRNPLIINSSSSLSQPPLVLYFWKIYNTMNMKWLMFYPLEIICFLSFMVYDALMHNAKKSHTDDIIYLGTFVYAINPYSILSFGISSISISSTFLITWIFISLVADFTTLSSILCAVACYTNIYPGYLVLAVVAKTRLNFKKTVPVLCAFFGSLGGLLLISNHLDGGDWGFMNHVYLSNIFALNTTPNMGIFWYMYVEMFDHFNLLFVLSMQLIIFSLCFALFFRFSDDPLFMALMISMSTGVLQPYNNITDFGCLLALTAQWSHLTYYLKNVITILGVLVTAMILSPLFYFTWLCTGTTNANFYFAAAILHGLGRVQVVSQIATSYLKFKFTQKYGADQCLSNGIQFVPSI